MNLIDRDELRRRLPDDTYLDDAGFPLSPDAPILDASERVIQSLMLSVLAILDAMPSPTCETCWRKLVCVSEIETVSGEYEPVTACSAWQPREETA